MSGTHPAIAATENEISDLAKIMTNYATLVEPGEVPDIFPEMTCNRSVASLKLPEFLEAEELSIRVPKNCKRCKGCRECSYRGIMFSRDKQLVVERMEELLK